MSLGKQIVGNAGLFYVCYQLSRRGWNVISTSRNTKGIDVVAYNQEGKKFVGIQVKALSKPNSVRFGKSLDDLMGDFWIIVDKATTDAPRAYVLKLDEVKKLASEPKTEGSIYWLQPNHYAQEKFAENWERLGKPH